jgi:hypothetical protein
MMSVINNQDSAASPDTTVALATFFANAKAADIGKAVGFLLKLAVINAAKSVERAIEHSTDVAAIRLAAGIERTKRVSLNMSTAAWDLTVRASKWTVKEGIPKLYSVPIQGEGKPVRQFSLSRTVGCLGWGSLAALIVGNMAVDSFNRNIPFNGNLAARAAQYDADDKVMDATLAASAQRLAVLRDSPEQIAWKAAQRLKPREELRPITVAAVTVHEGEQRPTAATIATPPPRTGSIVLSASTILSMNGIAKKLGGHPLAVAWGRTKDICIETAKPHADCERGVQLITAALTGVEDERLRKGNARELAIEDRFFSKFRSQVAALDTPATKAKPLTQDMASMAVNIVVPNYHHLRNTRIKWEKQLGVDGQLVGVLRGMEENCYTVTTFKGELKGTFNGGAACDVAGKLVTTAIYDARVNGRHGLVVATTNFNTRFAAFAPTTNGLRDVLGGNDNSGTGVTTTQASLSDSSTVVKGSVVKSSVVNGVVMGSHIPLSSVSTQANPTCLTPPPLRAYFDKPSSARAACP